MASLSGTDDNQRALDLSNPATFGVRFVSGTPAVTYFAKPKSNLTLPPVNAGAQLFTYKALEPGYLRLLKRVPQPDPNILMFEFLSAPFTSVKDQYSAISYCWGNLPTDRKLALADGSYLPITAKVEEILRNVLAWSFGDTKQTLWLDAVCINQDDLAEKSFQIPMMGNIYDHASSVEIWLDSGNDSAASLGQSLQSRSMTMATFTAGFFRADDGYNHPPYSTEEIVELMWSPWFERAWVVQEFCYGKNHQFHFRGITLTILFLKMVYDWSSDLAFGRAVDRNGERCDIPIPPMIKNLTNMFTLRDRINFNAVKGRRIYLDPLEDILCRFYTLKASKPHDKIYAMLGLATGGWTELITPDYTRPAPAIYLDVMEAMFDRGTDFCMLGFAGLAASRPLFRDVSGIPSWLPDFSTPPPHNVWSYQYGQFNATGFPHNYSVRAHYIHLPDDGSGFSGDSSIPSPAPIICRRTVLILHGVHIDTVAGISKGDRQHNLSHAPQFIRSAVKTAESLHPYPSGESARDVVRNVLVAGSKDTAKQNSDGAGFDRLNDLIQAQDGEFSLDAVWATEDRYFQKMLFEGAAGSRGVFWTKKGYMGLASNEIESGDEIWLISGARVPFAFRRPFGDLGSSIYAGKIIRELVCEAYVHGIMNGEMINLMKKTDLVFLW
jgi:Heterokaryon incompatibility protein (HET)